ncbi:MAG: ChaN family lipoprotein, partial [Bacteroidales bacterium]|nr:ChaN family lipoprotein [Bacteroidales bacterium]
PFDSTLDCYASLRQMPAMGRAHTTKLYLDQAQAIKDATMAWNIMKNLDENKKFIHFNGAYHSDYHQSIIWYLNYYLKENKNNNYQLLTITVQEVDDIELPPVENSADFIILTPNTLTKTY